MPLGHAGQIGIGVVAVYDPNPIGHGIGDRTADMVEKAGRIVVKGEHLARGFVGDGFQLAVGIVCQ